MKAIVPSPRMEIGVFFVLFLFMDTRGYQEEMDTPFMYTQKEDSTVEAGPVFFPDYKSLDVVEVSLRT